MSKPNVPLTTSFPRSGVGTLDSHAGAWEPGSSGTQPIPTGILVSAPSKVCPAKKPTLKRIAAPRAPASQIPWLWIVTVGSIAWAAFILTIGLSTAQGEPSQPAEPRPAFELVAVAAPSPQPAAQEPIEELVERNPLPIAEAPKLPMRAVGVARNDPVPPAILFEPDLVEVKPARSWAESNAQQAQPAPLRKDIDLNVFASCEQIGTNMLFMKDPTDAFKKARAENKLVFMVHLSGNLEDKEFT
jgi:hypothetical protein